MAPPTTPAANSQQLADHLTRLHLPPSPTFVQSFLASQTRPIPLPSLCHSARFRILNADIRLTLAPPPAQLLPHDLAAPGSAPAKERRLPGPIVLQIAWIEDIGRSKWSQMQEWEDARRDRGRERVVGLAEGEDSEDDGGGGGGAGTQRTATVQGGGGPRGGGAGSKGPFKLHLHDAQNPPVMVHGVTVGPVEGIHADMPMGAKVVVRDVVVARGVMLLDASCASVLGGKVAALDERYREGRIEDLGRQLEGLEARGGMNGGH